MDSYNDFETFETPTTILKLNKKEADVLRPYFEEQMKLQHRATYEKKYQYKLTDRCRLRFIRTTKISPSAPGSARLGALGVTFNNVVAMDSPSGRTPGEFHWASTLWHEMSHVYILKLTNDRVPRWFTEGLAVHEETATTPDWGDRLTPEIITAIRDKKLLPVARDRPRLRPSRHSRLR